MGGIPPLFSCCLIPANVSTEAASVYTNIFVAVKPPTAVHLSLSYLPTHLFVLVFFFMLLFLFWGRIIVLARPCTKSHIIVFPLSLSHRFGCLVKSCDFFDNITFII